MGIVGQQASEMRNGLRILASAVVDLHEPTKRPPAGRFIGGVQHRDQQQSHAVLGVARSESCFGEIDCGVAIERQRLDLLDAPLSPLPGQIRVHHSTALDRDDGASGQRRSRADDMDRVRNRG